MNDKTPPYHHGDLRATLLAMASQAIETDGLAKLSLRKLAAEAGVSHNAPYMHFAGKDALVAAVVAEGFGQLRARIAGAGGQEAFTSSDWAARVRLGFAAYIAFAQEKPGLYALMHVPVADRKDSTAPGTATLQNLAETLKAGQVLGCARPGDPRDMALWVWATLHGAASLTSKMRDAFEGRTPQDVTDIILDDLLVALAP